MIRFGRKKLPRKARLDHAELLDDVARDGGRGRRGQRQDRHAAEAALEPGQVAVRGPEVMAPLADAVGLVDGDEAQVEACERVPDRRLDALRRRVAQLVRAGSKVGDAAAPLVELQGRVQVRRAQADLRHGVDLVLHERDQRRDDQRRAAEHARRDLVGERFTRARRHDADAVAPGEHGADDLLLSGAERFIAETSCAAPRAGPRPPRAAGGFAAPFAPCEACCPGPGRSP